MPQHREQPSHKKSQRNDEGHFRFATDAITKSDGDFNHAQRATAPHYRLKPILKPAGGGDAYSSNRERPIAKNPDIES